MKILRTPDSRFENLADYPFAPNYTVIKTHDNSDLRIHHLDEGPADGPIVLCMHGQPVWSYLYRKMIPYLTAAGVILSLKLNLECVPETVHQRNQSPSRVIFWDATSK